METKTRSAVYRVLERGEQKSGRPATSPMASNQLTPAWVLVWSSGAADRSRVFKEEALTSHNNRTAQHSTASTRHHTSYCRQCMLMLLLTHYSLLPSLLSPPYTRVTHFCPTESEPSRSSGWSVHPARTRSPSCCPGSGSPTPGRVGSSPAACGRWGRALRQQVQNIGLGVWVCVCCVLMLAR